MGDKVKNQKNRTITGLVSTCWLLHSFTRMCIWKAVNLPARSKTEELNQGSFANSLPQHRLFSGIMTCKVKHQTPEQWSQLILFPNTFDQKLPISDLVPLAHRLTQASMNTEHRLFPSRWLWTHRYLSSHSLIVVRFLFQRPEDVALGDRGWWWPWNGWAQWY